MDKESRQSAAMEFDGDEVEVGQEPLSWVWSGPLFSLSEEAAMRTIGMLEGGFRGPHFVFHAPCCDVYKLSMSHS